jgi:AAA+ superfamily predicted ATPase
MNPELVHHLRSLTRLVYVVTEEEDRFLTKFHEAMKKHEARIWVFNPALGLQPIGTLVRDWSTRAHAVNEQCATINDALIQIYKDDPKDQEHFYIITDPDRYLTDPHVQRRILNIVHQVHNDVRIVKCILFVGQRRVIPEKLQRYVEVVHDKGLTDEEISQLAEHYCKLLRTAVPPNPTQLFKGLTSYELEQSITQSVVKTKKDPTNARRVDPDFIRDYRRKNLMKTDLINWVDTENFSIDSVGGIGRFKEWAKQAGACWTPEGQKFGLKPPRGVLLVGVYGCGKSLSSKALAKLWGVPLVQLELGKLMSSGVGDSENNLYRALRIIEGVSPCIVWIDEAEKSLSGSQSSGRSDAGTTSRVLGILSTWVQENNSQVSFVMTANSLKTLPAEMVNRMSERFFFDIPNETDRIDILKIHLLKNGQNPENYNLADLAEASKNLVGREIEQAIESAMMKSFVAKKAALDEEILKKDLAKKPRIIRTMADDIKEILDWVGYDEEADDGVRARLASDHRSEHFKMLSGGGGGLAAALSVPRSR